MNPKATFLPWLLCAALFSFVAQPADAQPNKLTATLDGITFDSAYDNGSLGSIARQALDDYDLGTYVETGEKGTRQYWFRFTMTGVAGRNVTLHIDHTQNPVPFLRILDPGPGAWRRMTSDEAPDPNTLTFSFSTNTTTVELAFFEPLGYTETLVEVTNLTATSPHATLSTLGQSFENRDLHLITVNNPAYPDAGKHRVWVHARVHAGEITSTHTMLGFLGQVLEESETGRRLREYVTFHIVPQVNVDGIHRGHTRWDAQGIDIESEWCNIRVPEAALLKARVDDLMTRPNPISVALNLHSTVGNFTDSFFFKHLSPSVTVAFEGIQQNYIDAVDAATPLFDNLSAQTSQLNPCTFIESYFWNNWGESVMALTEEGHYYRRITDDAWTDGAHYREIGRALARGLITYYNLPPGSEPDPAPSFTTQPVSQILAIGQLLSFSANSTSAPPVAYQWWLNGEPIAGATNSTYGEQLTHINQAGAYAVVATNTFGSVTSSLARLVVIDGAGAPIAFADDFETNSANRWIERAGFAGGGPDYTAGHAFDYSTYFSAFLGGTVPPAPHSTGNTTHGLRLTVNDNDAVAAVAAVCLYPKWQSFEAAHTLKFDMWINYPGGPSGSGAAGSTENAFFGLNHSGDYVNWDNPAAAPSDGVWFTVTGEGGATTDYRAHVGGTNTSPLQLAFADSGLAASGATNANASTEPFPSFFPAPTYETPGAPGKHWVEVEIGQTAANMLSWRMNGNLIAQRTNQTGFTNGNIMLGFADLFSSLASPAADSFLLYDNVRVELDGNALGPLITMQPTNQTRLVGETALFSVDTAGLGPLHYQWRQNGTNLPAATNMTLTLLSPGVADSGSYDVQVANAAGIATSFPATLTVIPANTNPPTIAATPTATGLDIAWAPDRTGWRLEMQTNSLSTGMSGNWVTVPGSDATNLVSITMALSGTAFFRLVYP